MLSRLSWADCKPTVPTGVSKPCSSASPGKLGSSLIVTVVARPGIGRYVKYRNFNGSWASLRSVYGYLSGDVGVCSRKGNGGVQLGQLDHLGSPR